MPLRYLLLLFLAAIPPLAFAQTGLTTVLSDPITVSFVLLNIGLTIYFTTIKFDRFAVLHGPEVLTTVGICGCFLGIALALTYFDASNVSSSVPKLLEGVKTAFWASLSGVVGSLFIRARHRLDKAPISMGQGAAQAATLDDVVASIRTLQTSLSGTEEGSLLTQLKLMRQEQSDSLTALRGSFEKFAEKMAEDGSKALIEALKEVIRDFNTKISEQFGENFAKLNDAVGKLLIWQQQYKEELDRLQEIQKASATDLKVAADGVGAMVEHAGGFTQTAVSLEVILRGLNHQYELIEQAQRSLSAVLMEMKDVTPQFSQKLEALSEGMRQGVERVQSVVAEVVRNFGNQTQSTSAEMKQLLTDTIKKSNTDINEQLIRNLEVIRQGVISLDKGLQEELTKSLESLGRQLGSLSEKFVSDYGPLTDSLRDVVRIASTVRQ